VRDFDVSITAVSSGLFKFPFPAAEPARSNLGWMDAGLFSSWRDGQGMLDDHLQRLLPETLDFAKKLGAASIICFSFSRGGAPGGAAPSGVISALAEAAERCARAGVKLLVETEEGHWADTGERSAALVRRVGNAALGINWDPANALIDGDVPFPVGYDFVKGLVGNVHFKDARVHPDGSWELVGEGEVDWAGQIEALTGAGYSGAVAIEPHLSPSVASTRNALARLRQFIEAAQAKV
jgi:sugar phosphate isomerase/epimerase